MRHSDEDIEAIVDALTYAIVDALTYASDHNVAIEAIVDALRDASDDNVDELKGFAESVLDGLRAAGFELRTRSAYPPTCPECAEVVHDAYCPLVGDGRPVDKEESHA